MTPVINPWVFYLIGLVDPLKFVPMFGAIAIAVYWFINALDDGKLHPKYGAVFAICLLLALLVPTSKTVTKMVVAQNATYERMEVATDTVQMVYDDIMELFEEDDNG